MLTLVNARLIDPETDEARPGGMVIAEGRIQELLTDSTQGRGTGRIVDCDGKWLAPGIIDIGVKIGEPGERHKESFRTAGAAAAAGGVTTMVTRPDTSPAIDTPEGLEFLLRRSVEAGPVRVMPMAALTKGREGAEMTEIGFLMDAGAVAFTDARAVANVRVFQRCLTYAAGLGALLAMDADELCEFFDVFGDHVCEAAQQLPAGGGRQARPGPERPGGRGDGGVDVLGVTGGDLRERFTGGGIDDGEGLSRCRGDPCSPDIGLGG